MEPQLTPEQEAIIDAEMEAAGTFDFEADDIAEELGIPPRSERDWTDAEIDRIWAEYKEGRRAWFTAQLLYPDLEPFHALALLK